MPRFALVILMLSTVTIACAIGGQSPGSTTRPSPTILAATNTQQASATPNLLTDKALSNLTYSIGEIQIQFADGKFSGQLPGYPGPGQASIGQFAYGNLNNDGAPDAVAIASYWTVGTTGHFSYLEAIVVNNGKPTNIANVIVGDREVIQSVTITGGQAVINLIAHKPTDGACCPSSPEVWKFQLQGDKWAKTDARPQ